MFTITKVICIPKTDNSETHRNRNIQKQITQFTTITIRQFESMTLFEKIKHEYMVGVKREKKKFISNGL